MDLDSPPKQLRADIGSSDKRREAVDELRFERQISVIRTGKSKRTGVRLIKRPVHPRDKVPIKHVVPKLLQSSCGGRDLRVPDKKVRHRRCVAGTEVPVRSTEIVVINKRQIELSGSIIIMDR